MGAGPSWLTMATSADDSRSADGTAGAHPLRLDGVAAIDGAAGSRGDPREAAVPGVVRALVEQDGLAVDLAVEHDVASGGQRPGRCLVGGRRRAGLGLGPERSSTARSVGPARRSAASRTGRRSASAEETCGRPRSGPAGPGEPGRAGPGRARVGSGSTAAPTSSRDAVVVESAGVTPSVAQSPAGSSAATRTRENAVDSPATAARTSSSEMSRRADQKRCTGTKTCPSAEASTVRRQRQLDASGGADNGEPRGRAGETARRHERSRQPGPVAAIGTGGGHVHAGDEDMAERPAMPPAAAPSTTPARPRQPSSGYHRASTSGSRARLPGRPQLEMPDAARRPQRASHVRAAARRG